jgi:hypothetical protein
MRGLFLKQASLATRAEPVFIYLPHPQPLSRARYVER